MVDHLELVAWFPNLHTADEKKFHRSHRVNRAHGEWYDADKLEATLQYFGKLDTCDMQACDKAAALATRRRL